MISFRIVISPYFTLNSLNIIFANMKRWCKNLDEFDSKVDKFWQQFDNLDMTNGIAYIVI